MYGNSQKIANFKFEFDRLSPVKTEMNEIMYGNSRKIPNFKFDFDRLSPVKTMGAPSFLIKTELWY